MLRPRAIVVCVLAAALLVSPALAQTITGPAGQISEPRSALYRPFKAPRLEPGKVLVDDMIFDARRLGRASVAGPLGAFDLPTYEWRLWEFGVLPVEFTSEVTESERDAFFAACETWAEAGVICLPRLAEPAWVRVQKHEEGCFSEVGMGVSGPQPLNLADGCWSTGTVAHEIAHALGIIHEHQRADRDTFVTVNYENVEADAIENFTPYVFGISLTEYDFGSVMHYPRTAFARSAGLETIVPKPGYEQAAASMGQRRGPSTLDVETMREIYRLPPLVYRQYPAVPRQITIGRGEALSVMAAIDAYYIAPRGLNREAGLSINGRPDFLGLAAWFFDIYVNTRYAGYAQVEARYNVMANITQTDEWRVKHPGQSTASPIPVPNRLPFDRSELLAVMTRLDDFYRAVEGLQRPQGLSLDGAPDFQGIATWVVDVYMTARLDGGAPEPSWQRVVQQIRLTDEWRSKH